MSEHAIEVVSDHGELSLRLVCHAVKGAPCRMRPADPDIEEWSGSYEGEMIDNGDCWAVEWQTAVGFEDGVRSELEGVYASIPVVFGYDEGVTVRPAGEHSMLAGLDIPDAEVLVTRKDSLTVRTVAELDALPEGTRAIDATQTLLIARHWSETMGGRNWASMSTGGVMGSIFSDVVMLPATVLWAPGETGR